MTRKRRFAVTPPEVAEQPGSFDPWLAMLHDCEMDPDPKTRVAAAKSILRMLAAAIARGAEIPAPLREWLHECLRESARTGDATAAFRLKPGRGRYAQYRAHMGDAAQLHAVMSWHSIRVQAAADEVANLPGRVDASNLVKHHGSIEQRWTISGPYIAAADDSPSEQLATPADLAAGKPVVVVFRLKLTNAYAYVLRVPRDLLDVIPSKPARNRRK